MVLKKAVHSGNRIRWDVTKWPRRLMARDSSTNIFVFSKRECFAGGRAGPFASHVGARTNTGMRARSNGAGPAVLERNRIRKRQPLSHTNGSLIRKSAVEPQIGGGTERRS